MGNCYQAFEIFGPEELLETQDISDPVDHYSPPRWTPNRSDQDFLENDTDQDSENKTETSTTYSNNNLPRQLDSTRSHDFGGPRRLATLSAGPEDDFSKLTSVVTSWRRKAETPSPIPEWLESESTLTVSSNNRFNTISPSLESLKLHEMYHTEQYDSQRDHYYSLADMIHAVDFELRSACNFSLEIIHTIKHFLCLDEKYFVNKHDIQVSDLHSNNWQTATLNFDGSLATKIKFSFLSERFTVRRWALQSVVKPRRHLKMYDAPTWAIVFITSKEGIVPFVDLRFRDVFASKKSAQTAYLEYDLFEKQATKSKSIF